MNYFPYYKEFQIIVPNLLNHPTEKNLASKTYLMSQREPSAKSVVAKFKVESH